MAITLDPKTEANLKAIAEQRHVSVEAFLTEVIHVPVPAKLFCDEPCSSESQWASWKEPLAASPDLRFGARARRRRPEAASPPFGTFP